ncbi:hypothetical protein [Rhizobium sp. WW_1]|jgi:hypothetical protein|uniref:hypothetical protein n=1 Tax=Rhizobium sp. WW_1 TaxID=1907375 RepID=UPI0006489315|nr:hypothetical protein [Rhizobium sp. WW_1]RKD61654.1 hypothetical protein BJ928_107256 [Rhizobium sp. WW_1]
MPSTVPINDLVALQEQAALAEYYRNRSLIQAQAIFDLQEQNAALTNELQSLKASPADPNAQEIA